MLSVTLSFERMNCLTCGRSCVQSSKSQTTFSKNALFRRKNTDRRLAIEDHQLDIVLQPAACGVSYILAVFVLVVLGIFGEVIKN